MANENTEDYEVTESGSEGSFTPQSIEDLLSYSEGDDIEGLDEDFKLIDEQTYASEIKNFRKLHSDADDLFKKEIKQLKNIKKLYRKMNQKNIKELQN